MKVFENYAYYYNSFYKDKDYKNEAKDIDFILKKYGREIKSLINFGCGTGKHDFELHQLGYAVQGVDLSSEMISIAQKNATALGIKETFCVGDLREYSPEMKYDAVLSLFHVMSYQNTNEDVIKAFLTARKCLESGGIFVFDVWYGPGVLTDLPVVRTKEVSDDEFKLIRIATPTLHDKTNVVDVSYHVLVISKKTGETQEINETHNMRYFFRPELEQYMKLAGFELIDNIDCKTMMETNYESWTSYFICRAI